jgi:hypothetical protein
MLLGLKVQYFLRDTKVHVLIGLHQGLVLWLVMRLVSWWSWVMVSSLSKHLRSIHWLHWRHAWIDTHLHHVHLLRWHLWVHLWWHLWVLPELWHLLLEHPLASHWRLNLLGVHHVSCWHWLLLCLLDWHFLLILFLSFWLLLLCWWSLDHGLLNWFIFMLWCWWCCLLLRCLIEHLQLKSLWVLGSSENVSVLIDCLNCANDWRALHQLLLNK